MFYGNHTSAAGFEELNVRARNVRSAAVLAGLGKDAHNGLVSDDEFVSRHEKNRVVTFNR